MQHQVIKPGVEHATDPYKLIYGENTPPNFERCAVEITDKNTNERRQCKGARGFGRAGCYCRKHRYPDSRK